MRKKAGQIISQTNDSRAFDRRKDSILLLVCVHYIHYYTVHCFMFCLHGGDGIVHTVLKA